MAVIMSYKKIIFLTFGFAVVVAAAFVATKGIFAPEQYEIEQVAVDSKDVVLYTDDKPVGTMFVDNAVPKKDSGNNKELASNKNTDVQIWIE